MLPAYSNHQIYKCYCRLPWFPRQIWLCWAACRRPQFVGRVSTEPRGSGGIGWIRSNPKAPLGPPRPPRPPEAPNAFSHIRTYSDMLGKVKGERGRCLVANHSHWRPRNTSLRGLVSVTIGFGQAWQQSAPVGAVRCTAMMVVVAESRRNSWLSAISTSMYCRMTF